MRLWFILHATLRVALGGLFLYSGVQKALDPADAVLAVHGYALVPGLLIHSVALGLIVLEIVLGILLIAGLFTRFAAGSVGVLTVIFLGALIQAKARGLDISCGCFGGDGTGEGVGWLDILRELPILAAAAYLALRPRDPYGLDKYLRQAGSSGRAAGVAVPIILVVCIVLVSLAVPMFSGAMDLPQVAANEEVSVSGPPRTEPLPAGTAVPDFSAPGLYGGTVAWQAYQGVPTVLVLWASWCPDCRVELPRLARVADEFPGVKLVSIVTADGQLPGPTPEKFMQSRHLTFPVALDSADLRLADAFGVQGFPTVCYVGTDGRVVQVTVGAVSEDAVRSAIQAIAE